MVSRVLFVVKEACPLRNPCLNGGTCIDHIDGDDYSCNCVQGYEGKLCGDGAYLSSGD